MIQEEVRIEVRRSFDSFGTNFYVVMQDCLHNRVSHIAAPVVMKPYKKGEAIPRTATFKLEEKARQQLMDDLWRAGTRPSDHQDAGPPLIKQYDEHIADLKSEVAFGRDRQVRVFNELSMAAQALAHRVDPLQINGEIGRTPSAFSDKGAIVNERREYEQDEKK